MGVVCHFAVYLAFMALYGIALTAVQTTLTTMLQEETETCMHGRALGLMSSLYAGCYPIGMALFGPLADKMPLQLMMILSGAVLMLLAGYTLCDLCIRQSRGAAGTSNDTHKKQK